jgi:hypothetical protein
VDDDGNGFIDDIRGWDFVGASAFPAPTPDADPMDGDGHGTHVAGTVAAAGNNGIGVVGVAFRAKVMALKGLDDNGTGWDSNLAAAIVYAAQNGADVINNSWSGAGFSRTIADAVDFAHSLGVVVVAAAGNDHADARGFHPAGLANVITVAASTPLDATADFSNWGTKIEVSAPGEDVLSLRAAGTSIGLPVGNGYARASGTSMASPHVAGGAALVLSRHPDWSVDAVRQALRVSARDLGAPGLDPVHGYGRLDAGAASRLSSVLEAVLKVPAWGTPVAGATTIRGTARGPGFASFVLDFGLGAAPTAWTTLGHVTVPVDGDLGVFPANVPDGTYTVRLRAFDASGRVFEDRSQLIVDYVSISAPAPTALPSTADLRRTGSIVPISGTAAGPSFLAFRLQWARGLDPTAGWSETGLTLAGGGAVPVRNGALASWDTRSITVADFYTVRVLVDNAGFTSEARTIVYLEPDLLGPSWPVVLDTVSGTQSGPLQRVDATGAARLVLASPESTVSHSPARLHVFQPDGAHEHAIPIDQASYYQPAAAGLDGSPGDETVVAERTGVRVFRGDNSSFLLTPSVPADFRGALVLLEDLDGDGALDVLAQGVDADASRRYLFAWRGDGRLMGGAFPIVLADQGPAETLNGKRFLVADLDGNDGKEIVVVEKPTSSSIVLRLFAADGSARPWSPPAFPDFSDVTALAATDFDHDGRLELIVAEGAGTLHVLEPDGSERPGWPVRVDGFSPHLAIADLDRNGVDDIIVSTLRTLFVIGADGRPLPGAWPLDHLFSLSPAVVADLDGDGSLEILVTRERLDTVTWPPSGAAGPEVAPGTEADTHDRQVAMRTLELVAFRRDGSVLRSWRLLGASGIQPGRASTPVVADFDGNGTVDVAVAYQLIRADRIFDGLAPQGVITALTTGARFDPTAADWPSVFRDRRNTAVRGRVNAPPIEAFWTNVVGATPHGAALTKTAATVWGNAGAVSRRQITAGDGYVEFTAAEVDTRRMAGLGNGDASQSYTDIDHGILLTETGTVWVYESGLRRGLLTTYAAGDRFRVAVESGVVRYRKNGAVFYTSGVRPRYPLLLDVALYTTGATVTDAEVSSPPAVRIGHVTVFEGSGSATSAAFPVWLSEPSRAAVSVRYATVDRTARAGGDYLSTGGTLTFAPGVTVQSITVPLIADVAQEGNESFVVDLSGASGAAIADARGVGTIVDDDGLPVERGEWTNVVGATPAGDDLTKATATAWGNAGAVSTRQIASGNGYVEFTATEVHTRRMAGLGNGDASQSYTDVDHGILLTETGTVWVYESGLRRGMLTTYVAGDRFRVGVESGVVKYRKNGVVFYTSSVAPRYPLLLDAALYSEGATITDALISFPR